MSGIVVKTHINDILNINTPIHFDIDEGLFQVYYNGIHHSDETLKGVITKLERDEYAKMHETLRPVIAINVQYSKTSFWNELKRKYAVNTKDNIFLLEWDKKNAFDSVEKWNRGDISFYIQKIDKEDEDEDLSDYMDIYLPYNEDMYLLMTEIFNSIQEANVLLHQKLLDSLGKNGDIEDISESWVRDVIEIPTEKFQIYLDKRLDIIRDFSEKLKRLIEVIKKS